jgi:hypothetical protein
VTSRFLKDNPAIIWWRRQHVKIDTSLTRPVENARDKAKFNALLFGAIMMKAALALCVLLLLLVVMFQFSSLALANPVPYPAEPSQEFPTLKVNSPKNEEVLTATSASLNLTVTKPDSWNFYWLTTMPVIGTYDVFVYLDGDLLNKNPLVDPGSSGFPTADYSVFLSGLTRGTHTVKIDVGAFTYYDDPEPEHGDYLTFSKNVSETVHFTVNADLPTPFPTPTPTSEPQPEPFPTTLVATASGISATVVGLGLLFYFKKRKR